MPKTNKSLFRRLTRLFRSGPLVKKKIRTSDTAMAVPDKTKSSGVLLFQKSTSPTYATITGNAYNLSERLMRYQDFNEMEYTPELARGMDIYADESVASDEKGRVLHIFSSNPKIKELLEDLFYNTLNVEFNLRSWTRSLVKYGDFFLYNDVSPEYGVVNAFPIPVNEVEREENYDREDPFAVRFRWVSLANRILENWEVTHFRLLGNDLFLPYGSSVIEPARRIWRQLILIEDAMLVYRVVRAPERRVFYIDVGNTPADEVPGYVEEQKKQLRSQQVVDRTTGRVDLRYNPLSVDEDYFIAVRGSDSGTKIETLKGGENAAAVEDVQYIQKKLFAALGIPRAYLGYDELLSSKATLAQEDIRFSRSISVIQKTITAELNKLAIIHLYSHGYEGEELQDFILRLSNPSTVAQQQKLELIRTRAEIAGSFPEGIVDKQWIRKEVLSFTDEHIDEIDRRRIKERMIDAKIDAIAEAPDAGGGGGGGGGGGLFGGAAGGGDEVGGEEFGATVDSGEEDVGGGAEESPAGDEEEITAANEPEELDEPEVSLLTSGDDLGNDIGILNLSEKEKTSPVKVGSTLDKHLYNRGRRRTHGSSKTHLPDFAKMTGNDNHSMNDPYDNDWIKASVSNPLGESVALMSPLPGDMRNMLKRMSKSWGNVPEKRTNMLVEDIDVWDGVSEDQRPVPNVDLFIDYESHSSDDEPEEQ